MKTLIRFALIVSIAAPVLFAAEINVSPGGPIATLPAARDAVRKLRAAGETGAIGVVLQPLHVNHVGRTALLNLKCVLFVPAEGL